LIEQLRRFIRRRLLAQEIDDDVLGFVATAGVAARVALASLMMRHLAERLVNGDARQHSANVVFGAKLKLALLGAMEEGAKHRLDDVLRIDSAGEPQADALARHGDEPIDI